MDIEQRKTIAAITNSLIEKMNENPISLTREILALINLGSLVENSQTRLYEPKQEG